MFLPDETFKPMTQPDRLPALPARATTVTEPGATHAVRALIAVTGERALLRFLEFFAANIRNPHTRRAYGRAVARKWAIAG
jgi:hypothetical protein